ncbi:MAG: PAS domain S-box protein [Bacteroidota bacterium]|nr:PAS domain S-box protein [Bacteroidota bacterium]
MKNQEKTKEELLKENEILQKKVKELGRSKNNKTEEALLESQERFNSIFNHNPNPTHLVNSNFEIILTNLKLLQIKGLKQEEIIGKKCYEVYQNNKEICKNCAVKQVFEKGINAKSENQLTSSNGSIKYYETYAYPVYNKEGEIAYAVESTIDISERKKSEKRLRESEEIYKTLFTSSKDAIMTLAPPTWKFTSGNPAYMKMFGIKSLKELKSLGPWEISPKKQADGQLSSVKAKEMIEIATNKGSNFFEWRHKNLNGKEFSTTVLLTKIEMGDKMFLQATVRNISKEKKSKKEIIEKNEQLELVMQGANLGWWDWDIPSGKEIYNEILPKSLGYKLNEIEANIKWWENKIHPDDAKQVSFDLQQHFDGKTEFYRNKHRIKNKTGEWKWFFDHGKVISRDKDGKPIRMIGTLRDIDNQQQAEKDLKDKMNKLEKWNKLSVGRELKMIELKKEINELLRKDGLPTKYEVSNEKE